jgi:predicted ester cyclase
MSCPQPLHLGPSTAIPKEPKLIERWFYELFTDLQRGVLHELVTEDFVTRDPSGKIGADSPAAFRKWLNWHRSSFTDAEWTQLELLHVEDTVVARYTGKTTYRGGLFAIPAKDQRVTEMGILIFRIRNNRICELCAALCDLELVLEMGAIPTVREEHRKN